MSQNRDYRFKKKYQYLINILGSENLQVILKKLREKDKASGKKCTGIVLEALQDYLRSQKGGEENKNRAVLLKKNGIYSICSSFSRALEKNAVKEILKFILRINSISGQYGEITLSVFSSTEFKVFLKTIYLKFLKIKSIHPVEECLELFQSFFSLKRHKLFPAFIRFLGSGIFLKVIESYRDLPHELLFIIKNCMQLFIRFPKREDFRLYITKFILEPRLIKWLQAFSSIKKVPGSSLSGSFFVLNYLYYIFLNQEFNAEVYRCFIFIVQKLPIRLPEKKRLLAATDLLNAALYFKDSLFLKKFIDFYISFRLGSRIRQKLFSIIFEVLAEVQSNSIRSHILEFFLTPDFHHLIKTVSKSSVNLLNFLTALTAKSLSTETGEYFKIIDEKKFLDLILRIKKRDRLFHNYTEVYQYIDKNYFSTSLMETLMTFCYFHYTQTVNNRKEIHFLNEQHKMFTRTLSKKYFRIINNKYYSEDIKERRDIARRFYRYEEDIEKALLHLRLAVIIPIFEAKKIQNKAEFNGLLYLLELARNWNMEDELYASLKEIIPRGDLLAYEAFIREKFSQDPFNISLYIRKDGFYAVYFKDYSDDIYRILLPVIKTTPLRIAEWAYTDSKAIFLPVSLSEFQDPVTEKIENNRNFSLYIYLGLHEFSHIYAKSFQYDFKSYFLENTSNPETCFQVFNLVEDYRAENEFLKDPYYRDFHLLITEARKYFGLTWNTASVLSRFFQAVIAELYWEANLEDICLKNRKEISAFKSLPVTHSLLLEKGIKDYGQLIRDVVSKIRNMPLYSSLASIYLAVDIFHLLTLEFNLEKLTVKQKGAEHLYTGEMPVPPKAKEHDGSAEPELVPDKESGSLFRENHDLLTQMGTGMQAGAEESPLEQEGTEEQESAEGLEEAEELEDAEKPSLGNIENLFDDKRSEKKELCSLQVMREKTERHVFSYNSQVKGYTDLREIQVRTVSGFDGKFIMLLKPYQYLLNKIQEELLLLVPQLNGQKEYSCDEGELDISRVMDIFTQKIIAMPEIYYTMQKEELSLLHVIIGLDASGSTELSSSGNLTILDVEKIFAYILGTCFKALTPNVSYYAFNSTVSTVVYYCPEAINLSMLESGFANRDGDFIRYINNLFSESDSKYRYFFLLSDGQPSSENYYGEEAIKDTAMAMQEVLNNNVQLIYFNIDPMGSEYFNEFIPHTTYAERFKNPEELIDKVRPMVLEIVKAVL